MILCLFIDQQHHHEHGNVDCVASLLSLQVTDLRLCSEPRLPGELVLAVSVDLGRLACLGQDLRLLDDAAPGTKLVFEMADGTYLVWPGMPDDWAAPTAADTQKSAALPSAASADQVQSFILGYIPITAQLPARKKLVNEFM